MKDPRRRALEASTPMSPGHPRHRTDIQGMRALAVGAVVLAHAGIGVLGGGFVGVDLFFVLSGFLITDLLIRDQVVHGRISLANFWARRVRRLLPASTLVLVVTAVASALWLPAVQRKAVTVDIVWSALFSANWRFAQQGADYFAQDRAVSPVQHYWSLGVEEQFYLVWPLIVIVCGVLASQRWNTRLVLGIVAVAIVVGSCAYSIGLTAQNQPYAYFGTPARAWQLGIGALLATAVPLLTRLTAVFRLALALAGLAAFVWALFALADPAEQGRYPGLMALIPTLAAAALIAAGTGGGTIVGTLLSWRPLQWLGDLSYSLYLWHFPVLIIGTSYFAPAGWIVTTGLVVASVVAAWVSYIWVETPIRRLPFLSRHAVVSMALGLGLVGVSMGAAVGSRTLDTTDTTVYNAHGDKVDLGQVLIDPEIGTHERRLDGCTQLPYEQTDNGDCVFGAPDGDKTAVLLGDSHAGSLFFGLDPAAREAGWQLRAWVKNACKIADATYFIEARQDRYDACDEYRRKVLRRTVAQHPDLVILISAVNDRQKVFDRRTGKLLDADTSRPLIAAGYRKVVEYFVQHGIPVAVVADWPRAKEKIPECLLRTRDARRCGFDRSRLPRPEPDAVRGLENVRLITVDRGFCGRVHCTPVPGKMLVYLDDTHLTRQYAESLAPQLRRDVFDRF